MNPIITKCLKELGSATPRLDYVRGMLETLLELQGNVSINAKLDKISGTYGPQTIAAPVFINGEQVDESSPALDSYLRGTTGSVTESRLP